MGKVTYVTDMAITFNNLWNQCYSWWWLKFIFLSTVLLMNLSLYFYIILHIMKVLLFT